MEKDTFYTISDIVETIYPIVKSVYLHVYRCTCVNICVYMYIILYILSTYYKFNDHPCKLFLPARHANT